MNVSTQRKIEKTNKDWGETVWKTSHKTNLPAREESKSKTLTIQL